MLFSTKKSDVWSIVSSPGWRVNAYGLLMWCFLLPLCSAQTDSPDVGLLTGTEARESLRQLRSVTLKSVPFAQAVSNLQQSLRYAIVVDHTIDPDQPMTLATGLLQSDQLLRRLAVSIGADVSFTDHFAFVGRPESVKRLRTIMELRRTDLRLLRTKLSSDVYRRCFEQSGNGWPDLMRPDRYVREQVLAVGLKLPDSETLPHDLWRSQTLPALEFVERVTVVLNQFDLTFSVSDEGDVRLVPVDERPFLRRRVRVPSDRKAIVESLLETDDSVVQANWSGSRVTIDGTVEVIERVEAMIRNETEATATSDLRTQRFTMAIPSGSTVFRVIESLKASGVDVRLEGSSENLKQQFLQQNVELEAEGMLGSEFFLALFKADGVTVSVEADHVLVKF